MKRFEEFVDGLNSEMEIPEMVDMRFEDTLKNIGQAKKRENKIWVKAASIAAAVVVVGSAFCVTNPTLAAKIPVIGNIFAKVEKNVTYSGDYSNSQTLSADEVSDGKLMAENKGIKLTATEVYCDGYSVFVTMEMQSDKVDFTKISAIETVQSINMDTCIGIDKDVSVYDYDIVLEGQSEGKDTFVGMMKFDKDEYSVKDGSVNLKFKKLWVGEGMDDGDDEKGVDGDWTLKIPYTVDQESGKEITVNKKSKNGITVEKIFVSPYQMVILSDVPYTMPYADKTREQLEKEYGDKLKPLSKEEQDKTYEEIKGTKDFSFYKLAIFDQNGNPLEVDKQVSDSNLDLQRVFCPLKGTDVTKVHIYLTENEENIFGIIKAKTEKEAKKISEMDFEVDIK